MQLVKTRAYFRRNHFKCSQRKVTWNSWKTQVWNLKTIAIIRKYKANTSNHQTGPHSTIVCVVMVRLSDCQEVWKTVVELVAYIHEYADWQCKMQSFCHHFRRGIRQFWSKMWNLLEQWAANLSKNRFTSIILKFNPARTAQNCGLFYWGVLKWTNH